MTHKVGGDQEAVLDALTFSVSFEQLVHSLSFKLAAVPLRFNASTPHVSLAATHTHARAQRSTKQETKHTHAPLLLPPSRPSVRVSPPSHTHCLFQLTTHHSLALIFTHR